MDTRRNPILSIELARDGSSLKVVGADGKPQQIPCRLDDDALGEHRRALRITLDNMKAEVRRSTVTIEDASRALQLLNTRGLSLMMQIFRDRRDHVVDIFQESFPLWRSDPNPAVITTAAALNRFMPLEFLPLFELSPWPPCHDWETLQEAARRFPGFSTVIKREFRDLTVPQDLVLYNEPRLPLKCFVEKSLPGVKTEVSFFIANEDNIDIDGPWPTSALKKFPEAMAGYLQYGDQGFKGQVRAPMDQVQHFICHAETDHSVSADSFLKLSYGNIVTIAELQASFATSGQKKRSSSGPVIFLNACGTSKIDPMAVTSFPRFFLEDNQNRGVIGTETNVPDRLAAEFSKCFYQGLLKGLNLGKAIYEAKWTMLRDFNNPLGILYTVYADPELHVSKAVQTVNPSNVPEPGKDENLDEPDSQTE
jgi:hypothetical protein